MALTPYILNNVFATLVAAARAGQRCPVTAREGVPGLPTGATSALARAGKIKVEVYAHNWRVVEILEGPHAGARTAPCPHENRGPYLIIGRETIRNTTVERDVEARREQTAHRNLYRSDFQPT